MIVDATPAPGRTIQRVRYYANGTEVTGSSTMAPPHEYNYVVPAGTMTGSTITLQARAEDDLGIVGVSAQAFLQVRNDLPVATFAASISGSGQVTVDASAITDTETATSALEVCWDWDNNGACDTPFSTTKVTTHDYGTGTTGTFVVRMVVRDAQMQTAETTRTVVFQDIQFIGGQTVMTSTWYGTIIVTGDITVGAGQVLTVSEGTQVLFVRADTNNDMVGDYTLVVQGSVVVNGTAANPVVFTGQNAAAKVRGGWDEIQLLGAGSVLNHVVVEYADTGLDVRGNASLSNVTVRSTRGDCIVLSNADGATLTDVTTTQCGASGVWANTNSTGVTVTRLTTTSNASTGLYAQDGSSITITNSVARGNGIQGFGSNTSVLNVADSVMENNTYQGLAFVGPGANGTVTRNNIRFNGGAGLQLESTATGDPNPVVNLNNIYSNAQVGADVGAMVNPGLSLETSTSYTGTSESALYSAPAGRTIRRVRMQYADSFATSLSGELVSGSGTVLVSLTDTTGQAWYYLPNNVTSVKLRILDSRSAFGASLSIDLLETKGTNGTVDVSTFTTANTPNLRQNYLGTFPSVLSRVSLNRTNAADLQGFVGAAMDNTWSTGPYRAGSVDVSEAWSGTVYLTGSLTVAAGATVTVAPGTRILAVNHDQNLNGQGDFTLTANGPLNLQGTMASPVTITGLGAPVPSMFQAVEVLGAAAARSAWTFAVVEQAVEGIRVRGNSTFTDVTVRNATSNGVRVTNGNGASFTRLLTEENGGFGILLDGTTTGVTVSRSTIRQNTGSGMAFRSSGVAATVEDSTIRDNGAHGVLAEDSSPVIRYCSIQYNGGSGLYAQGTGGLTADHNVVKFNSDVGVQVWNTLTGSPTPVIQYSNIFSNAVTQATTATQLDPGLTVTTSTSYTGTSNSMTYTAPAGQTIRRVRLNYADSFATSLSGALVNASNGAVLTTLEDTSGNVWFLPPAGVTSVYLSIIDSRSAFGATLFMDLVEVTGTQAGTPRELLASTLAGTTDARFNFWTSDLGAVPSLIRQARTDSVNYQGFTGFEYPGTGANAVGPRP